MSHSFEETRWVRIFRQLVGVIMVFVGIDALLTQTFRLGGEGPDISEWHGLSAVLWGLFFVVCGVFLSAGDMLFPVLAKRDFDRETKRHNK